MEQADTLPSPQPHVTPLIPCQGITQRGHICNRKPTSSLCPQHDPNRTPSLQPRSQKRQNPFDPLTPISKNQRNSHSHIPFNVTSSAPPPSSTLTVTPQLSSPSYFSSPLIVSGSSTIH